jgi:hypothetical protein
MVVLWYWSHLKNEHLPAHKVDVTNPASALVTLTSKPRSEVTRSSSVSSDQLSSGASEVSKQQGKIFDSLFQTPIDFYGKVIDEKGSPVAEASISASFVDSLAEGEKHTKRLEKSGNDGLFHFSGHGISIVVQVSKKGYYRLKESNGNFDYVNGGVPINPHFDATNPAIFLLRKVGHAVSLIHLEKYIRLKKDGTPIEMDLRSGQIVSAGHGNLKVEAWTNDQGHQPNSNIPYDWHCRISVPGGGLVLRNGAFDFEAPKSDYTSFDEISMPASMGSQWQSQVRRQYFLKLSDGRYARIDFQMIAEGDHLFALTSDLNPSPDDRNLELDAGEGTQIGSQP